MGAREIHRDLEQWEMDAKALRRRMILAPTPRERERWYAVWLLAQGVNGGDKVGRVGGRLLSIGDLIVYRLPSFIGL